MSPPNFCGLDFGTTNSTVAIVQNNKPLALDIDPDNTNPKTLKSLFYLNQSGDRAVGQQAINRYLWDIRNIPAKPPVLIDTGRKIKTFGPSTGSGVGPVIYLPEYVEVDVSGRGRLLQSLKSVLTNSQFTGTNIFGKFFTIEELLTQMMTEIKRRSEQIIDSKLDSVVIGRPVRYVGTGLESLALSRMEQVAHAAGYVNVEFEYEPVGAALNYGLDITEPRNILVFDFGGGTLDVCIMSFPDKKVVAVSGRPIGGDLLNSTIVEHKLLRFFGQNVVINGRLPMPKFFLQSIVNWYRLTLLKNVKDIETIDDLIVKADNPSPVVNLKNLIINDYGYMFFGEVDRSKIALSSNPSTQFYFNEPGLSIEQSITKNEFEKIISTLVDDTKTCIQECLRSACLSANQIDQVLVTGGSSKVPIFINLLNQTFGASKIIQSDPFTSVALGLALRAQEIYS